MVKTHVNPILTAKQMRMAEQYSIDSGETSVNQLMERAGQAIATASNRQKRDGGRIVIVIGAGNNGADGFVAARLLRLKQVPVTVIPLLPVEQFKGQLKYQAELAKQANVKIRPLTKVEDLDKLQSWLNRAVLVVDTIFGTGLSRPITGWLADAIHCINQAHCPILAVDMPSGIHADSGEVLGIAIQADVTLPIAAYKWGHWLRQGKEHAATMLTPASIGIRPETIHQIIADYPISAITSQLIDMPLIHAAFPKRPAQACKHTFGHLWIFGGSIGYTGAPKLAAMGAQAVGTGLVSIACPDEIYPLMASSSLEVMVHPQEEAPWQKADAIVAGPGWSRKYQNTLMAILKSTTPVVLDADALNILAENNDVQNLLSSRSATTVLTPHPGEAARLLDLTPLEVQTNRLHTALALVDIYHVWVVFKGAQTIIVSPHKHVWVNPFASSNLATAGTGDVLAGMIGGLLACKQQPETALPAAVGLHGFAGEQSGWHRAGQLEDIIAKQVQRF